MEKKNYVIPLLEVTQIKLGSVILDGSPTVTPAPPINPTPGRKSTPF